MFKKSFRAVLTNQSSRAIVSAGAITLGVILVNPVQAQTVLSSINTGGDDMDGMRVLVEFLDGTFEEAIWGTTGVNAGGAFGTNWDLTFSGSTTFGIPWRFNATNPLKIASLTLNGAPGNTAFDDGSFPSTPGSARGQSFSVTSGQAPDTWQYSNPIDISAGDLWGTLSMNWLDGFMGTMRFVADTDNGTIRNPVTTTDVPEPVSTIALLGIASLGIISTRKRKQDPNA
ncbi:PEP-CTERM sorting domain-containing protein [Lusitaniella coriacea LEGE 07157]|uniref:PEP-CTERM sorting domain-containing protein n=1 Tax=Lusitaniella coriacea LEGE 07157 TaxID=945747 RepID=A0A8J7JA83_9CYAN|nr:PEP-CTERM sorting domain-containing protein [Lusitaniella coriacea]MBE9116100.1 PEP-CTERM sorting domain-containing protein [Lusitaniella coriacea LEGE 07157]